MLLEWFKNHMYRRGMAAWVKSNWVVEENNEKEGEIIVKKWYKNAPSEIQKFKIL